MDVDSLQHLKSLYSNYPTDRYQHQLSSWKRLVSHPILELNRDHNHKESSSICFLYCCDIGNSYFPLLYNHLDYQVKHQLLNTLKTWTHQNSLLYSFWNSILFFDWFHRWNWLIQYDHWFFYWFLNHMQVDNLTIHPWFLSRFADSLILGLQDQIAAITIYIDYHWILIYQVVFG